MADTVPSTPEAVPSAQTVSIHNNTNSTNDSHHPAVPEPNEKPRSPSNGSSSNTVSPAEPNDDDIIDTVEQPNGSAKVHLGDESIGASQNIQAKNESEGDEPEPIMEAELPLELASASSKKSDSESGTEPEPEPEPELEPAEPQSIITSTVDDDASWPKPVVICGPSGVGKGTLIEMLMKKFPNEQFGFSVSHTTRKPRDGEVDGVHYNFSTVELMKSDIEAGKFIEHAEVHGNFYGTSVEAVESVRSEGKVCILDIDVQGAQNVKMSSLSPIYIFIAPPSMELLESRLRGRGTDKEEDIVKRLGNAADELAYGEGEGNFDRLFVNDNLDSTFSKMMVDFKAWYPQLIEVADESTDASNTMVDATLHAKNESALLAQVNDGDNTTVPLILTGDSISDPDKKGLLNSESEEHAIVGTVAETLLASRVLALTNSLPENLGYEHPNPLIICGPSGVGKGTLIDMLTKKFFNQFDFCVRHTTRTRRIGEIDGVPYNFTSVEDMLTDIGDGKFIEYSESNGDHYGTSIEGIQSIQSQGKICVLDIDVQAVENVKKSDLDPYYLFIAPPSMAHLAGRLRGRGTETEEEIETKLGNASQEMVYGKSAGNFDKFLVNDELQSAFLSLCQQLSTWYPHLTDEQDLHDGSIYQYCSSFQSYCKIS